MRKIFGVLLSVCCVATACDNQTDKVDTYLDTPRLMAEAKASIQPWLENAPDGSGFFRTRFNRTWQPRKGNDRVSLVRVTRLLYIFSTGYDLTGDTRYRELVRSGGQFLLAKMRNSTNGGWHKIVNSRGEPIESRVHPYSYSFVIFGLSHAYRVTGDEAFLEAALATWQSGAWPGLVVARRLARQGYADAGDGTDIGVWTQNPYMHLFEALLILHEVTGSAEVWSDIEAMAEFLEARLIQPSGCIPEWYRGPTFSPLDDTGDGYVELGHQVEWAYLLIRAVEGGLDNRYRTVAERLIKFAIEHGLDRKTGGLHGRTDYAGQVRDEGKRWWAQAELMRTAAHFAARHGRDDLWSIYQRAQDFVRIHYVDQEFGGWTGESFVDSGKNIDELGKVIGYHAVAFYVEALSLTNTSSTN